MITGHQRSGTTALMNSLSRDPNIELINESLNNELFYKWNLKPEKEIRSFLNNLKKPLLTKPVNETKKRGIRDNRVI